MHIPARHTSGDFWERFTEDAVERLRTIIHRTQEKYLKKPAKKLGRTIVISLDSSIYEVFGNCKKKSSQSFKHIFGFRPLFLPIHNIGELLHIVFRGGKAFTSTGAVQMLKDNIDRLTPYFDKIILPANSRFYEQAIVDVCEKKQIKFIITAEISAPLLRRFTTPELVWSELVKDQEDDKPKPGTAIPIR